MTKMSRRTPLQTSRVVKTLWPPQPGTAKLLRQHGQALLCVRYRRDASGLLRYTTIELVVARRYHRAAAKDASSYDVAVAPQDKPLRSRLRALGAQSTADPRIWTVNAAAIKHLDLADRIIRPSTPR